MGLTEKFPSLERKSCSLALKPTYCPDKGRCFKVIFRARSDRYWDRILLPVLRRGSNIEYCAICDTVLGADVLICIRLWQYVFV